MKKILLLFLITIIVIACNYPAPPPPVVVETPWKTLDFGPFKMKAPGDWTILKQQGIDSFVGGVTNGRDSLWFDYGWYAPDFSGGSQTYQHLAVDTVNGLLAFILIPEEDGRGEIGIYIPRIGRQDKFILTGTDITGTPTILKMFKSLVFAGSDTTKNPALTSADFEEINFISGKGLFISKCNNCHASNMDNSVPSMKTITDRRSDEWVYRYLTNRKSLVGDSGLYFPGKNKSYKCPEFPALTRVEVALLLSGSF